MRPRAGVHLGTALVGLSLLAPGYLLDDVSSGLKTCVIKASISSEQHFMNRGDLCMPPTLKTPPVSATGAFILCEQR